jgi:hypothetical protein
MKNKIEDEFTIEDIFLGFVVFPEQLTFNMSITERATERLALEELYKITLFYAEAIPEHVMREYEHIPETITADVNEDLSNKMLLDSFASFVEDLLDWSIDIGDEELVEMSEELLGQINQTLLSSSLEYLN